MSSAYRLLCMNHDPAIVIPGPDWNRPEPAIAAALEPDTHGWLVEDHGKCDLLVGRYSYPLIEVCCPAAMGHLAHGTHAVPHWIDRDWLVLLRAAMKAAPDDGLTAAISALRRTASCWTFERLERLAPHLGTSD